jgi:hypothetical protein
MNELPQRQGLATAMGLKSEVRQVFIDDAILNLNLLAPDGPSPDADYIRGRRLKLYPDNFNLVPPVAREILSAHKRWMNSSQACPRPLAQFVAGEFREKLVQATLSEVISDHRPAICAFYITQDSGENGCRRFPIGSRPKSIIYFRMPERMINQIDGIF